MDCCVLGVVWEVMCEVVDDKLSGRSCVRGERDKEG